MLKIVQEAFPELKTKLQLDSLTSSLELRKIVNAGQEFSQLVIDQKRLYELFHSDKELIRQIKSIYKGSNSSMARLLYGAGLNIYSGNEVIEKHRLLVKSICRGSYDVNVVLEDSSHFVIEVKSGSQKVSLKQRLEDLLEYYIENEDWKNDNIKKIGVLVTTEIKEKDLR